jgi:hypothetical protein
VSRSPHYGLYCAAAERDEVPGVQGEARGLVRFGADGLAVHTEGAVYLVRSAAVSAPATSPPLPTPRPAVVNGGTGAALPLATKDLVFDPFTRTVFATVPSTEGARLGRSLIEAVRDLVSADPKLARKLKPVAKDLVAAETLSVS